MNEQAWFRRLGDQLPGWYVWRSSGTAGIGSGWYAVPAPPGVSETQESRLSAWRSPNRIGPYRSPQDLRAAALLRYGWDEQCETCGVLARECGHRQPERDRS